MSYNKKRLERARRDVEVALGMPAFSMNQLAALSELDRYEATREADEPSFQYLLDQVKAPTIWRSLDAYRCRESRAPAKPVDTNRVPPVDFLQQGAEPPHELFEEAEIDWFGQPPAAFYPLLARRS